MKEDEDIKKVIKNTKEVHKPSTNTSITIFRQKDYKEGIEITVSSDKENEGVNELKQVALELIKEVKLK